MDDLTKKNEKKKYTFVFDKLYKSLYNTTFSKTNK